MKTNNKGEKIQEWLKTKYLYWRVYVFLWNRNKGLANKLYFSDLLK